MRRIVFFLFLYLFQFGYSQVGIRTSNPLGVLHIDGNKDNPVSTSPNNSQALNDFLINSAGNVGVGTVNPPNKLSIVGDNVNHPVIIDKNLNLNSEDHFEQLAIDTEGNVGIKSNIATIASVFTIQSQVRGLNMTNSSSNVNIPLSANDLIFNTLSAEIGQENIGAVDYNYITIPVTGSYEIQVIGAFNCSTEGIWGMNLQMRKGIVTNGAASYSIIETRRMASTFKSTTVAIPGKIYGVYSFNQGERLNFRLASGKVYTSSTTPDCGSVNISGAPSGIKIIITKFD